MPVSPVYAAPVTIGENKGQASNSYHALIIPYNKRLSDANTIINRELKIMAKQLKQASPRASGRLSNSWVTINGTRLAFNKLLVVNVRLSNTAPMSYFRIMGRAPGNPPPIKAIQQWCKLKGIPVEAAYPITKKIGQSGTQRWKDKENVLGWQRSSGTYKGNAVPDIIMLKIVRQLQ